MEHQFRVAFRRRCGSTKTMKWSNIRAGLICAAFAALLRRSIPTIIALTEQFNVSTGHLVHSNKFANSNASATYSSEVLNDIEQNETSLGSRWCGGFDCYGSTCSHGTHANGIGSPSIRLRWQSYRRRPRPEHTIPATWDCSLPHGY